MKANCVVCSAPIEAGAAVYSNLWEESLKQHPCCSKKCAQDFKVTVHWMPFDPPAVLVGRHAEACFERDLLLDWTLWHGRGVVHWLVLHRWDERRWIQREQGGHRTRRESGG